MKTVAAFAAFALLVACGGEPIAQKRERFRPDPYDIEAPAADASAEANDSFCTNAVQWSERLDRDPEYDGDPTLPPVTADDIEKGHEACLKDPTGYWTKALPADD